MIMYETIQLRIKGNRLGYVGTYLFKCILLGHVTISFKHIHSSVSFIKFNIVIPR